jgi:hypothetical protein
MKFPVFSGDAFDRGDLPAFDLRGERQAGKHPLPIYMTGAGAALALVAALLGTGQGKMFPKRIEQRDARFDVEFVAPPVDIERKMKCSCHGSSSCHCHETEEMLRIRLGARLWRSKWIN